VEAKIADLQAMRQELVRLACCDSDSDSAEHCRLIAALDQAPEYSTGLAGGQGLQLCTNNIAHTKAVARRIS
jgi:hypothetical protein